MRELGTFFKVVEDSLTIRSHQDLFHWLHDDVQEFVPHDVLIAAWGDFSLGLIHLDIISYLPGLRTTEVQHQEMVPFLRKAFAQWMESDRKAISFELTDNHFRTSPKKSGNGFDKALSHMSGALVQGMKDERGRHDCLYVALSATPQFSPSTVESIELLLPYLDAALRKVTHLPEQRFANGDTVVAGVTEREIEEHDLSEREVEIMRWVCLGKTNHEIGKILDISAFTVKNHLQRIFRKMDVINRAQAVAMMEKMGLGANG